MSAKLSLFELQQHVSGHILIEELPDTWPVMSDEEQDDFLTEHAWEPFEHYSAKQLWEFIDCDADSLKHLMERKGIEVVG